MRTFIAIELPEEIKAYLAKIQNDLRKIGADVKWVEPENLHLTLKFLGERDDKKIKQISELLKEISKDTTSYKIRISSLGAFPKTEAPRVIWVGISEGDNQTKAIAKRLEEEIAHLGIPKEDRPLSSHITLGRTHSGLHVDKLSNELNNLAGKIISQEFSVTKITLFKSTLTAKGPIYEALKEINLESA